MVHFDIDSPESLEFLRYKHLKDLKTCSEINFILGCYPTEKHISDYSLDNPSHIVYAFNIGDTEIDEKWTIDLDLPHYDINSDSLNYLKIDFNQKKHWQTLVEIFKNQISNIIFDSSTIKFIGSDHGMWLMEKGGLDPIRELLKAGGNLICESIHSDCFSFCQKSNPIKIRLSTSPFCYHDPVTMILTYNEMVQLNYKQIFSLLENSHNYNKYVETLRQKANQHGFQMTLHYRDYPLAKTRYPITQYAVFKNTGMR